MRVVACDGPDDLRFRVFGIVAMPGGPQPESDRLLDLVNRYGRRADDLAEVRDIDGGLNQALNAVAENFERLHLEFDRKIGARQRHVLLGIEDRRLTVFDDSHADAGHHVAHDRMHHHRVVLRAEKEPAQDDAAKDDADPYARIEARLDLEILNI